MAINWADLAVVLLIGATTYMEYKRGFLLAMFKMVSIFVSLFLSWMLRPVIYDILQKTFIYDWIRSSVYQNILKENLEGQMVQKAEQMNLIDNLNVPDFIKDVIKNQDFIKSSDIIDFNSLRSGIVDFVTSICVGILGVILIFVVSLVLMRVLSKVLDLISKIPIIKQINQTLGLVLGAIIGLMQVWFGLIIITLISNMNANFGIIYNEIDKSVIAKYLYENNILNYIIKGIFNA